MRTLQWRHNEHDSASNHQPHDCLLNRLFRRRSKKTSKLRVTGLCVGNSPGTGEFPAQMASNAENVSFWWRHHEGTMLLSIIYILVSTPIFTRSNQKYGVYHLWSILYILHILAWAGLDKKTAFHISGEDVNLYVLLCVSLFDYSNFHSGILENFMYFEYGELFLEFG